MTDVDVIVVGAGIQGAGVAQAAAAAGHSVLILERSGIASGTSSRSSKLIHGGLRYLESGQFGLVRECLRERALLLRNAPGLVRLVAHHIPVYRQTRRRPATLRAGLSLYALLGGLGADVRFTSLPRQVWPTLDGLRQDGLQVVFRYFDGQTDDAALTRAVVHSALELGARLRMPATLTGAVDDGAGMRVRYCDAAGEVEMRCRALVNAAGPWVDSVLHTIEPAAQGPGMEWVAGAHIVLPCCLTQGVYYTEAPRDGRAVFIMPWHGDRTLVGTTERAYAGDPATVAPSADEIEYLRDTVRHYFPGCADLEPSEAFAGLRVLPASEGSAFARPRDTRLHVTHGGRVVSIYGGKLTAYRASAARVLDRIRGALPKCRPRADTRRLDLIDAPDLSLPP